MDFKRLSQAMSKGDHGINSSEPFALTELPPNILDSLIPGYSVISRYATGAWGVDISVFVSVAVILVAALKGGQYLYSIVEKAFRYCFMANVYIDDSDDLFDQVMEWLAVEHQSASRRTVLVKTLRGEVSDAVIDASMGENGLFDYNKWEARIPPRYEPHYGRSVIWHNRRPFFLAREMRKTNQKIVYRSDNNDDQLIVSCISTSSEPIKDLLRTIRIWSLSRKSSLTTIRHPLSMDRDRGGAGRWSKTASRPSRPMETVILDAAQKNMIIKDVNEFIHPSAADWYARRGLPYRRGYLFSGPPGTGKTSLSFALAGLFGLDVYVISLQEPTLTEGDLLGLFNRLPRTCIVLLEDVDAAGLVRDVKTDLGKKEDEKDEKKEAVGDGDKSPRENGMGKSQEGQVSDNPAYVDAIKDLARELKNLSASSKRQSNNDDNIRRRGRASQNNDSKNNGNGISLSGLLNAIDGVATQEGRVLIMTTNHAEKLDPALVRPGRVDRKVHFRLAMREQVRELFVRMYHADGEKSALRQDEKGTEANGHMTNGTISNGHALKPENAMNGHQAMINGTHPTVKENHLHIPPHRTPDQKENPKDDEDADELAEMTLADLQELAAGFASRVPDDTYTPAEIQNHLMRYKKRPRTAVARAGRWMDEVREEKEVQRRRLAEEAERDDGE